MLLAGKSIFGSMTVVSRDEIIDYISSELEAGLVEPLSYEDDLNEKVDWTAFHPDEGIHFFLWAFCHEFRIRHVTWSDYAKKRSGIWGLVGKMFRGGPDYQFFLNLDLSSLYVGDLVDIAQRQCWIYPFDKNKRSL